MKVTKRVLVRCLERYAPSLTIRHRGIKTLRSGEPELKLLPILCERDKTFFLHWRGYWRLYFTSLSGILVMLRPLNLINLLLPSRNESFRDRVVVEEWALSDHHGHADLRVPIYAGIEHPGLASIERSVDKYYSEMRATRVRAADH